MNVVVILVKNECRRIIFCMIKYFSPTCRKVCTNTCHSHAFEYLSSPSYIELWMARSFLPTYYFTIIFPTKWHQHHCYLEAGCWWKSFFWCKTYHSGFVWSAMCSFSFYYICILSRTVWSLLQWFSLTELNSKSRWIDQKWFINRLSSGCWIKNIWPPIGSVTWFDKNVTKSHFRHCDKFNTRWRTLPKKVWFLILSFLDCKCYMKL